MGRMQHIGEKRQKSEGEVKDTITIHVITVNRKSNETPEE